MERLPDQVIVDSGFLYAFLLKFRHDWFDFIFGENQVTLTIAPLPSRLNAAHDPNAKPGLISTPLSTI
jgi:hypothetical protein